MAMIWGGVLIAIVLMASGVHVASLKRGKEFRSMITLAIAVLMANELKYGQLLRGAVGLQRIGIVVASVLILFVIYWVIGKALPETWTNETKSRN
ncbi:hypothetical protein EQG49_06765 [Periweissella cryptocerci]|uniref:Uncharacterized protein n=1 Tax=Periweissella cryptocerci TaxID=2506420 RepID=A0A4P6YU14_9LACO|nr:hypothetical protein [Periweissella cryptocerci]QBO36183.1 hypothetical protein EQG49_06765 [Periweissella cryptocerci]